MADEMEEVEILLESHPSLKITTNKEDKRRVVCELTSHEMPCTLQSIKAYINGKKYKMETENKLTPKEQELHKQYLVLKRRGQLYCKLTKRHINNLPHHIKTHFKGRRFQKAVKNEKGSLNKDKDARPVGEDESMWVPSESESESEENDGLGSDFEVDKTEVDLPDDSYSFEVLDTKRDSTDAFETTTESKSKQKGSKRKHPKDPMKKKDKLPKSGTGQRKKRKNI